MDSVNFKGGFGVETRMTMFPGWWMGEPRLLTSNALSLSKAIKDCSFIVGRVQDDGETIIEEILEDSRFLLFIPQVKAIVT